MTNLLMPETEDEHAEHVWEDEAPFPPSPKSAGPVDVNLLLESLTSFEE